MKKIFILGSSGFIGSNLLEGFASNKEYDIAGYSSGECNLLLSGSVDATLSNLTKEDVIIMVSSITRLRDNSFDSMKKNILMAENVSNCIKKHPVGQLIYLSTVDIYGLLNPDVIINEKLLPQPNDYYATSKIISEYLLQRSCLSSNIPIAILRLSGVYGPGDYGKSTINKLVESAIKGKIIIKGDGSDKRDFVHVKDVYKIINETIKKNSNITLNVATGKSYSIRQIAGIIQEVSPYKFHIEHRPKDDRESIRIKDMVYDCSLLKREFHNLQMTDIKDGVMDYISHYMKG